ncbi:hypothetical protein BE221DRAFT_190892 [Ostreococcus tauri]|uniref:Uncharacterized protein n=1 Tax=Ostreococcus tauri TaxID=70448 RepID=A0A1Y5IJU3_OSTTA|nr:hypothetical protein BE221DRAFT_190892 [Ostreococcus tauri]
MGSSGGLTRARAQEAFADVVGALMTMRASFVTFVDDRASMDRALETTARAAARTGRAADATALHGDLAPYARERALNDWNARRYVEDGDVGVLVTTDACAPRRARGERAARVKALVHYDSPRDASTYRARLTSAFADDALDCDATANEVGADAEGSHRVVISLIVGPAEATRFVDVSKELNLDASDLSLDVLRPLNPAIECKV